MIDTAATTTFDNLNYRDIAQMMTQLGCPMNHSSCRNYIFRIMKKIIEALAKENGVSVDTSKVDELAKSFAFQTFVGNILQAIEADKRSKKNVKKNNCGGVKRRNF